MTLSEPSYHEGSLTLNLVANDRLLGEEAADLFPLRTVKSCSTTTEGNEGANTARWSQVATSYHSVAKWTHPLIIDTLALSQHFIVSCVSSGMSQSTWQREIKDGAACNSHFDIHIDSAVVKINWEESTVGLLICAETVSSYHRKAKKMCINSLITAEMQESHKSSYKSSEAFSA